MSRTDIHRPFSVITSDPYMRNKLYRFQTYGNSVELIPYKNMCGCPMCTGQPWRRLARRQERVRWRAQQRELLKLSAAELEDVDVPFID
jgi:hypothetical protein